MTLLQISDCLAAAFCAYVAVGPSHKPAGLARLFFMMLAVVLAVSAYRLRVLS